MTVTFHTATFTDVETMLKWAAAEGWNPGLDDAAAFLGADGEGFFVAKENGEMVAGISVVNHNDEMSFLGLYLCLPAHRGKGIGYDLWQHAIAHAGDRCIGLDGVAEQQSNYARSGFVRTGTTTRFDGPLPETNIDSVRDIDLSNDIATIAQLDGIANGYLRPSFLSGWIMGTPTRKTVVYEVSGEIKGFATARQCHDGCKIGPIIADNVDAACALMSAAGRAVGVDRASIDLPSNQPEFAQRLTEHGFTPSFETARMYRGTPPVQGDTLFAVSTREVG
ncbi:GNAT family N-acetyltransferase [Actibacterium lipolyticum]|uniref:N-acetyltransferase domain-containing protein n=1 Tax=Actibacterium lipolyticum TaxID=1524263 RepID=A0A238JVA9_9RHOB|nr:GNAT family N-acetyltransferase [Actibacterium lipolyticum]SMX34599.1 hypothetical protein COL8621_01391 [Actibacterium lipolyticum]